MLPDSDFHKKGKMMFLLVGGRYYYASNSSSANTDYLQLCNIRFSLDRGELLADEEKRYRKRNSREIDKRMKEIQMELSKSNGPEDLKKAIRAEEDLLFFYNIVKHLNDHLKIERYTPVSFESGGRAESKPIFVMDDSAVVNRRVYPLYPSNSGVFASVGGTPYTFGKGELRFEEVGNIFKNKLDEEITAKAIDEMGLVKELNKKLMDLKSGNGVLYYGLKAKRNSYSFEVGNMGIDFGLNRIYCLIGAHSNYTTGCSYSEGQSALTVDFANGELGTNLRFASRSSRDEPFVISTNSHCFGSTFKLNGPSLEDKVEYLREGATIVFDNQAFYQVSQSSSDGSYQ